MALHNGILVPLSGDYAYYSGFSNLLVINRGVHEPLEEYVFQQLLERLPPDASMVELGAYWGHYSMWLKSSLPSSSVTLVEPEQRNLLSGKLNFEHNNLIAKDFINAFVGPNGWRADNDLRDHLTVLHSDIQGAELDMLDGAKNTLERKDIDYLLISTHSQEIHHSVIGKLIYFGYIIEVSADVENQTTSYDGFVFARSPLAHSIFTDFHPMGRSEVEKASPVQLVKSISGLL